jgi:hypothetical protein
MENQHYDQKRRRRQCDESVNNVKWWLLKNSIPNRSEPMMEGTTTTDIYHI